MKTATELLKDGQVMCSESDIVQYQRDGRTFYIDNRTKINLSKPYIVKPFGKSYNGYYLYVCPCCSQKHGIHKSSVSRGKPFNAGCSGKGSRYRKTILWGELLKFKEQKIILDF